MRKKTLLLPDKTYSNSAVGSLPRSKVSVAAAPWEDTEPQNVEIRTDPLTRSVIQPPKLERYFDRGQAAPASE